MKTTKNQNNQEAGAAQTARIEASGLSQADDFRAYAPAGEAMASSASPAAQPQHSENVEP